MYKKVLAYLALTLGIAEVGVVLVSWLLTAAMPESFTHSLTSPEGIRWFTGHFVDHLTSVWLVWLVLISITIKPPKKSWPSPTTLRMTKPKLKPRPVRLTVPMIMPMIAQLIPTVIEERAPSTVA